MIAENIKCIFMQMICVVLVGLSYSQSPSSIDTSKFNFSESQQIQLRTFVESSSVPQNRPVIFHVELSWVGNLGRYRIEPISQPILTNLILEGSGSENRLQPLEEGLADVVYGSRFLGGPRRPTMFWHMVANKLLTFMTNILYNTILTDMETGYKVFRREVVKDIPLYAKRFEFEPEFTAKILKRNVRIFEVPISFNPRDYDEGKKIGIRDAFEAVWALLKYRFVD